MFSLVKEFHLCSTLFDFHLFADDANLFYRHKDIKIQQKNINDEIRNVSLWLTSDKLSLNIEKSNFVIFHPVKKKKKTYLGFSSNFRNQVLEPGKVHEISWCLYRLKCILEISD